LQTWTEEALSIALSGEREMSEDDLQGVVDGLNKRAQDAMKLQQGQCSDSDDASLANAARWWEQQCTRLNDEWNEHEGYSRAKVAEGEPHPAARRMEKPCGSCDVCRLQDDEMCQPCEGEEGSSTALPICRRVYEYWTLLRNYVNRHTKCNPNYCLRLDPKTKQPFCRFHFPQEKEHPNTLHFRCKVVGVGENFTKFLVKFYLFQPLKIYVKFCLFREISVNSTLI
jgi:hypothetical protein